MTKHSNHNPARFEHEFNLTNLNSSNFAPWTGRIMLDTHYNPDDLQVIVTDYVKESGIPAVVGYYTEQPPALTLLRWPDDRQGHRSPEVNECRGALAALALLLRSDLLNGHLETLEYIVPNGKVHAMIGLKFDGYDNAQELPIGVLEGDLPTTEYAVQPGYMISARHVENAVVPYGEGVGIIEADAAHEREIHVAADNLRQHHYGVERGKIGETPPQNSLYETIWAHDNI